MDKYIDNFVHGIGTALRNLGTMASNMTEVHWALLAVIVIGTGVVFLRGKPVHGS